MKTAQAFRPHVLDMFEPQDHPDDIPYPGGPPTPPYDSAGWTLAYQMGVKFDRILDGFDGPFEKLSGLQKPAPGKVTTTATGGYTFSHAVNDSFTAINRLLTAGEEVSWMSSGAAAGAFFVATKASTAAIVGKIAADLGLNFEGVSARPAGDVIKLRKLRIALADQYGGSMPSGWTRWLLEQFEFPFEVVFPQALDAGNLASQLRRHHLSVRRRTGRGRCRTWRSRWRRWCRPGRGRTGQQGSRDHPGQYQQPARGVHGSADRRHSSRSSSTMAEQSWRSDVRR